MSDSRYMMIEYRVVAPLRLFLALLFAILVFLQTFSLPGQFAYMAQESPESAHLRWPMTAVSVFWVLCVQAVIVATWKLLTLVKRDRIFSEGSLRWVDAILWAIAAGWASLAAVTLYFAPGYDDPAVPLILILLLVGIAVLELLMVVMRALLRQATTLRTDMEAVI